MEDFENALETCVLHDIGSRGSKYTRNNGREGMDFTQEIPNIILANKEWCKLFHGVEAIVEPNLNSDHNPIVLRLESRDAREGKGHGFHYEACWGLGPECHNIVQHVWRVKHLSVSAWQAITEKLTIVRWV